MTLGFTGTRYGMKDRQIVAFKALLQGHTGEFHHGDCVGATIGNGDWKGADIAQGKPILVFGR
jgi:hypothetical protein